MQCEFDTGPISSAVIDVFDRRPDAAPTHNIANRRADLLNALLSVGDQALFSGTSFVSAVIVGRACTPHDLGLYYLTLTVAFIAIGIQDSLISSPFAIFSNSRRGRDLREFTGSTWIHYLALATVFWVALLVAVGVTTWLGGADFLPGLRILLLVLPLMLLREAIRRFAFARMRLPVAIAVDLIVSIVQIAGLLLLARGGQLSIVGVFSVMGGACAVASVGWLVSCPHGARFVPARVWRDWAQGWHFASWSLYSYIVACTIPFIMPWIVTSMVSAAAAGLFGAASTLVGVTNVLVLGGNNFLTPKAAEAFTAAGHDGLRRVLTAAAMLFLLLIGGFLLIILLTGDRLAMLVFQQEQFRGCGALLAALAANVLAGSLGMIAVIGLWVLGKQRSNFAVDVAMFVATIVAAAWLVAPYGALGAALAALIGGVIGASLRAVLLHRALGGSAQVAMAN